MAGRPQKISRQLRDATFILPSSGQRSHEPVTLPSLFGHEAPPRSDTPDLPSPIYPPGSQWPWLNRIRDRTGRILSASNDFIHSRTAKGVFKCSLAYLLGSCGTFLPFLSNFLGHSDGKHIVATITVYFHAARTAGSMIEATICAFAAFLYAAFLSLSSMGVSIFFGKLDMLATGHAIVLIIFLGGGLGFVAWVKQRLGNPLVNVACSLTSLASITVFVKEGSVQAGKFSEDKVVQVLKMVILGIGFATLINLTVFPESAREKLNANLESATDHIGDLLGAITRAFLMGNEADMNDAAFSRTMKQHKDSLKALKMDLSESKWEHYFAGHEKRHKIEAEIVKCLQKLSQDLGGLRSAALVQFDLIRLTNLKERKDPPQALSRQPSFVMPAPISAEPETIGALETDELNGNDTAKSIARRTSTGQTPPKSRSDTATSRTKSKSTLSPADMFSTFIAQLGPPMKSLVHTLILIMDELPFEPGSSNNIAINHNFHTSLHDAVDLFKTARKEAISALYKNKDMYTTHSLERLADYEEIAASCGHFSFALVDVADEVDNYLDLLEDLKADRDQPASAKSYDWLKFWRRGQVLNVTKNPDDRLLEDDRVHGEDGPTVRVPPALQRRETYSKIEVAHRSQPWNYRLWRTAQFLNRDDIRFAGKVGIGAALLACPAFIASTRPTFQHLRLEWGLVSYMVVCSMTIGAVNTTGLERFLGTATGALLAVMTWIISHAHAVPLALLGWVISLGCFYLIVGMKKGPMGRFIFLTYNLSALYAYSLSIKDDDEDDDEMNGVQPEIKEIVLHRVVSVMIGCIWAIVITRLIWPISARTKLKEGICLLWLRMSLIWKRDPLTVLTSSNPSKSKYMDIREEVDLQTFLTGLDGIRGSAASEFELKGPFPEQTYKTIIERTQRMLDNFHGMNVVIEKNWHATTQGEMQVLRYTQDERAALSARISHLFSTLASTLKMEYPLNDVLPNIEHSRDRLLAKVFEFRRENSIGDADYELIYAYVLTTGQLAKDIMAINNELADLYGTVNEDNFRLE